MYSPKFRKHSARWKKVLDKLRGEGIAGAENIVLGKVTPTTTEVSDNTTKDSRHLTSKSTTIKTVDDLLNHCQVDLEVYEVDRVVTNKWESFQSSEDGPEKVELFQVKIWLKKKAADTISLMKAVHGRIMDEISDLSPVIEMPQIRTRKNPILLEPFITDHHISKLCFNGDEIIWNKKIAIESYDKAISEIMDKAKGLNVTRILLPTGNDLINIDSSKNATFRDTPQMTGEQYHTIISDTELLLQRTIKILAKIAPVDVVMVRGNHDYESMFHIGRSILAYFDNDDRVNVFGHRDARQYYSWKKVMIAMCHSHLVKADKLPQVMATEQPRLWGKSIHREAHVGHLHHNVKKTFNVNQDTVRLNGCTVRILDTLCPTDIWHKSKAFISGQQRTQALAFSPEALEGIMYVNS